MVLQQQIESLRAALNCIEPYPKDCVKMREPMNCRAFFPGGDGLWQPGQNRGMTRVLVLGSDFNNERNYELEMRKPEAQRLEGSRTWAALGKLLGAAGVNLRECFFTNAWPCLREGEYPNCGNPPGAKDQAFTLRCLDFFRLTLTRLKPAYVIPLGTRPTQFLSRLAPHAMEHWRKAQWRSIDRTDHITLRIDDSKITIIPVIHPSHPNQHHRLIHKTQAAEALHLRRLLGERGTTASSPPGATATP